MGRVLVVATTLRLGDALCERLEAFGHEAVFVETWELMLDVFSDGPGYDVVTFVDGGCDLVDAARFLDEVLS